MKVAAYARYSSDNQREESITAQIDAIQKYCKNKGFEIIKIYVDEAKSARTDNRPQFLDMISDSKNNIFEGVVIHKLDRFARNRLDAAFYKKLLKDNGVNLISVLENLDDSPESIILESVLQGIAEYFSANLSREVMKGLRQNAINGKHNGGKPPIGYDLNLEKKLIINEFEAQAVKIIFQRFIDGYGYMTIAKELNKLGYRTKSGKDFGKISIHDILLNEKYTGTYIYNKRADGKTLNKLKPPDEIIRVENAFPQIIPKELFEQVQQKLNSKKTGKRVIKMNYLLTGKIHCGKCDGKYTGDGHYKSKHKETSEIVENYRYTCRQRCGNPAVFKNEIEKAVINEILTRVLTDENISYLSEALSKKIQENQNTFHIRVKEINTEIEKLKKQIDKDFQLFYEDLMDSKVLAEKTNEKKLKINNLENELIMIDSKSYAPDKEKILKYLYEQKSNLESNDEKLQKKGIDAFVNYVIVYGEHLKIQLVIDEGEDEKGNLHLSDTVSGAKARLTLSLTIPLGKYSEFISKKEVSK